MIKTIKKSITVELEPSDILIKFDPFEPQHVYPVFNISGKEVVVKILAKDIPNLTLSSLFEARDMAILEQQKESIFGKPWGKQETGIFFEQKRRTKFRGIKVK